MADVIDLLNRPTYGYGQVDRILGLGGGTALRWLNGYRRGGRHYPPVIRPERVDTDLVTWGEFVETRLLAEYRDAGVSVFRMRPAIERLREELDTAYPLASARTWLDTDGQELVLKVQDAVGLDRQLALVVVRTGQRILEWTKPAEGFRQSVDWSTGPTPHVTIVRPVRNIDEVVIDPLRGFGEPVVRGVRTEIIGELVRAGETPEQIAEMYELPRSSVDAAVRYELLRTG